MDGVPRLTTGPKSILQRGKCEPETCCQAFRHVAFYVTWNHHYVPGAGASNDESRGIFIDGNSRH